MRSSCLAETLSIDRPHARTPGPVYGTPRISSSSCTVPSSPPGPCRATNATSGRSALERRDQLGADVDRHHLVAERDERVLDPRAAAQGDLALQAAAALEHGDLHSASAGRRNGTTEPSADPAAPGREAEEAGGTFGDRFVEVDLSADHGADAADALADLVRRRGGEVEPHRRAPAAVDVGGRAGDEGDVVAQRLRQAGPWCRCRTGASPSRTAPRRDATSGHPRGSSPRAHRASRRGARGRCRGGRRRTRASGPRRSTRGRGTG